MGDIEVYNFVHFPKCETNRAGRIRVAIVQRSNPKVDTGTLVILAFSTTAGVLVEFYDFVIYGFAAASAFPSIFFPGLPPTRALVLSYLAFGAGFRLSRGRLHFRPLWGSRWAQDGVCHEHPHCGGHDLFDRSVAWLREVGLGCSDSLGFFANPTRHRGRRRVWRRCGVACRIRSKKAVSCLLDLLVNLAMPLGFMSATAVMLVLNKTFSENGWRVAMLLSAVIVIPALGGTCQAC